MAIILFAKTSKGASRLSEQFRNRKVEKTYHAIVIGSPVASPVWLRPRGLRPKGKPKENRGVLINSLIKDEKLKKARHNTAPGSGTVETRLYYEVLKSNEKYSLLKIKIETGRFHQIRAQLSLAGFPILGDVKYGAKIPLPDLTAQAEKSVALCATGLSFYCATEDKKVNLSIPMPEEWEKYL